jgi:trimethylamine--corrinoid protein Co-methyltransferase
VRNFKRLEILTDEQVEAIHFAALDVLQATGVMVESEQALRVYEKGGCIVDHDSRRVKFPPGLVVDCLLGGTWRF